MKRSRMVELPEPPVRVIVGLGNPGPRYAGSRHNLGFEVVDAVAEHSGLSFPPGPDCGWAFSRGRGIEIPSPAASDRGGGGAFLLIRPSTFMNLSGRALIGLDPAQSWDPASILVVYDDLDLPPGRLRVRTKGSDGGHRGLRSLIDALETPQLPRLRVGIGGSPEEVETIDWVLGRPGPRDRELLDLAVAEAARGLLSWLDSAPDALSDATEAVMRDLNGWRPPAPDLESPRPGRHPDGSPPS